MILLHINRSESLNTVSARRTTQLSKEVSSAFVELNVKTWAVRVIQIAIRLTLNTRSFRHFTQQVLVPNYENAYNDFIWNPELFIPHRKHCALCTVAYNDYYFRLNFWVLSSALWFRSWNSYFVMLHFDFRSYIWLILHYNMANNNNTIWHNVHTEHKIYICMTAPEPKMKKKMSYRRQKRTSNCSCRRKLLKIPWIWCDFKFWIEHLTKY